MSMSLILQEHSHTILMLKERHHMYYAGRVQQEVCASAPALQTKCLRLLRHQLPIHCPALQLQRWAGYHTWHDMRVYRGSTVGWVATAVAAAAESLAPDASSQADVPSEKISASSPGM